MKRIFTLLLTVSAALVVGLLVLGIFLPWQERKYVMDEDMRQRQFASIESMKNGCLPSEEFKIGECVVTTWILRAYRQSNGSEEEYFKLFVSLSSLDESLQTTKIGSVTFRMIRDNRTVTVHQLQVREEGLSAMTQINNNPGSRKSIIFEYNLPEELYPSQGVDLGVELSVKAQTQGHLATHGTIEKTFTYVFHSLITKGHCALLHWFASL